MLFKTSDEMLQNTLHCSSLKPHQAAQDGRNAHFAVIAQHAGKDKWEKELKQNVDFMKEHMWSGLTNCPLKKFVGQHCDGYHTLILCSEHLSYQPPNKET